jgi:hypothetical protein
MKSHLGTDLTEVKNAPVLAKIAISIYWVASLLTLYFVMDDIFTSKSIRDLISESNVPLDNAHKIIIPLLAAGLAFAVLKLFLAFKLSTRKNWARIVVMIISTLMAAAFIYQAYISITYKITFLPVLKNTYWLVAEIVAASLLLLPKSRGWFALKRTSA